ncbi:CBS domain-containing protein [Methanosphaera sp.]|uniref:CBS domain-containing protein n=1 Tax=Methanosphaera sp. TaxID=2666342 RepID=UPI0025ED6D9B|nr:CBS domain-containing protein [Methanosphaera sp.]MEE1116616.1 CBS domain-containing protein [Methanosphaera sp.]MEE3325048.1 CBS domain-containing protein [Methanosphaera sp.]MEE3418418.1 CBS domain-containing protein [Methanosphaera sp.]
MELEMDNNFGIKDAVTYDVITASSDTVISDIADIMTKNDISSVVIEDEKVEGIVTTNNIISKVVSKNISPQDISAGMVMEKYVGINSDASLNEASSVMIKNNCKVLLVFEEEEFKGILTLTDIVRVSPELIEIFVEQKNIDDKNFHDDANYSNDYDENLDEGVCENCGVYGQLDERDGQFLCSECIDDDLDS